MELKNIEGTKSTPSIEVLSFDNIKFLGRSFPEDVTTFYDPIIKYITNLSCEELTLDVFMDYFNTASSHKLSELFVKADENYRIRKVNIIWHYEEGDDDNLEMGEIFEQSLQKCNFRYKEEQELMV